MDRPRFEVADLFRCYGADYRQKHGASMSVAQRRVMTAIELCRTAVLGGHLSSVTTVAISAMLTTLAPIGIVQNANRWLEPNGWRIVTANYYTLNTSMLYSLCRKRFQPSLIT